VAFCAIVFFRRPEVSKFKSSIDNVWSRLISKKTTIVKKEDVKKYVEKNVIHI